MSDWIPALSGLRTHPKTRRAARMLGVEEPHLVGHLVCLWWWALEYAPDGDLEDFEHEDIADGAGWTGDASQFVSALTNSGAKGRAGFLGVDGGRLIDGLNEGGRLQIHDWEDNQGDQFRGRIQAAAKKRAQRAKERDAGGTTEGQTVDHVPMTRDSVPIVGDLARANDRPTDRTDRTDIYTSKASSDESVIPEKKPRKRKPKADTVPEGFEEFWRIYPRKVAMGAAIKAYKTALGKTDAATILAALQTQIPVMMESELNWRPHAATWLNAWRWMDTSTDRADGRSWTEEEAKRMEEAAKLLADGFDAEAQELCGYEDNSLWREVVQRVAI